MNEPWRIELLGGLRARRDEREVTRFRTQKTGSLLAFLALRPDELHPREQLVDLLWPECDGPAGRNSLSAALSALRRELESEGAPLLRADRFSVGLQPGAVQTDVAEFEAALREAEECEGAARCAPLERAVELYRGRLLVGHDDEWIVPEARRLEEAFFRGVRRLVVALKKEGAVRRAIAFAERAVALDPAREEAQRDLVQLYAAIGQVSAARRQYAELERQLALQEMTPSASSRAIRDEIERRVQLAPKTPIPSPEIASEAPQTESAPLEPDAGPVSKAQPAITSSQSHLPLQLTRFFGREAEMERLLELLRTPELRFVTLTGPGGSGKTRLAIETARRFAGEFEGPIHFVALADLQNAELLPEAILDAIGARGAGGGPSGRTAFDQLVAALENGPTLLVLDNLEQLVEGGATLVRSLVERVPTLQLLVTSRQRLGVRGEREFVLLPLPTPHDFGARNATSADLEQFVSVQLFVDRASAVRSDFALSNANAPVVARLCRRLDGIPLAIELAAARSKVLAPAQMLTRLESSLDLLATGHKDAEERHRSLRATMEWSINLLPDELRVFWMKLGVFRGGWTLEAAEKVCEDPFALEHLEALQEASLVGAEEVESGAMRFRFLETVREYALELLPPDERERREELYAQFFEKLAQEAPQTLAGPGSRAFLSRLETEQDNLRAVLKWLLRSSQNGEDRGVRALEMTANLAPYWETRGQFAEGRSWLERALEATTGPPNPPSGPSGGTHRSADAEAEPESVPRSDESEGAAPDAAPSAFSKFSFSSGCDASLVARALCGAGRLDCFDSDFDGAREKLERSIALSHRSGDDLGTASALNALGLVDVLQGQFASARGRFEEALELCQRHGDEAGELLTLVNLGYIIADLEARPDTIARFQKGIETARRFGNGRALGMMLTNLGMLLCFDGQIARGTPLLHEGLETTRAAGETWNEARTQWSLGHATLWDVPSAEATTRHEKAREARERFTETLRIVRGVKGRWEAAYLLEAFCITRIAEGDHARGAFYWGAAEALRERCGWARSPAMQPHYERFLEVARAELGEGDAATFEREYQNGVRAATQIEVERALELLNAEDL